MDDIAKSITDIISDIELAGAYASAIRDSIARDDFLLLVHALDSAHRALPSLQSPYAKSCLAGSIEVAHSYIDSYGLRGDPSLN